MQAYFVQCYVRGEMSDAKVLSMKYNLNQNVYYPDYYNVYNAVNKVKDV